MYFVPAKQAICPPLYRGRRTVAGRGWGGALASTAAAPLAASSAAARVESATAQETEEPTVRFLGIFIQKFPFVSQNPGVGGVKPRTTGLGFPL